MQAKTDPKLLAEQKPLAIACPLCGTVLYESTRAFLPQRILAHYRRMHGRGRIHPAPADR